MTDWRAGDAELTAFLAATHGDPFALLGPHLVPGGVVWRAFLPGASRVEALLPDGPRPLAPRGTEGFFEGLLPGTRREDCTRLRAQEPGGMREFHDAYAMGPALGPLDDHLLLEGTHTRLHERLGAHLIAHEGVAGTRFAVWAPHARRVSVVGDFNLWDGRRHPMRRRVDSGLWELFIPGIGEGTVYKYELLGPDGKLLPLKADPFGFAAELRPATASVVADLDGFEWTDRAWMAARAKSDAQAQPMSVYEVHAPSWKRHPDGRFWNWDELAADLIPYAKALGFTHLQLMPVMEHPLDASWGYQPVGMHAVTARLGGPRGLMRFVNAAHEAGLGVLLDWVPAHFPQDAHGLARFDGTPLFEHPDPQRGFHPDWGTAIYDYGRTEVRAFLASNAMFWIERFHADGLRVDAVSSMIHLDYSRGPGAWSPNEDGGNDNRDAIACLRHVNALVRREGRGALMIAEEATDWSGVTAPAAEGGLGFDLKWNMGWMNDTLRYVAKEPVHRGWHHQLMNFSLMYAFNERFVLPLSHDEVVHGKASLLGRMPKGGEGADDWQRFANLRAYLGYMWGHPGKKLLFMGGEIAQWREWSEARELDWWLLQYAPHRGVQTLVRDLNALHQALPALHAADAAPAGFEWIDPDDAEGCTFTWLRHDGAGGAPVAVLCNFTAAPREAHLIGLPAPGRWRELLNTDATVYGGSGLGNLGVVRAQDVPAFGQPASAWVMLPPLAAVYLAPEEWPPPEDNDA